MKAVIPVAGIGSRLRPHTHTQPKALIPVAGKPILAHIIDSLEEAGFKDFVFIIGYLGEKINEYVTENYSHLNVTYVVQTVREGIGHALWMAKEHIENEDELLIALGDTIFDMSMVDFMATEHSALGTKKVEDPRRFGVVEVGADGFISKLVEKPAVPVSNLALVGIYKVKNVPALMEAIQYNISNNIRTKNEFQLTDALMRMIELGEKFTVYNVENWFDCGKKDALLETNAILLKKPEFVTNSDEKFENSIIIGPVNIHETVEIKNSIIGPNVSIGANAKVENSIVKESIIGPYAEIRNAVLHDSLIGNEASLRGLSQSLNIGESTEINYE
ncbi:MAG: glucose-1-phosphate thymidylyltransferase [Sphingobacteriales bacterium]|nr:MAG: glucose-1-phosphate thymidylyltransferase [Sphingobacteriales bacterium]